MLPGSGAGPGTGQTGVGRPASARAAADVPPVGYAALSLRGVVVVCADTASTGDTAPKDTVNATRRSVVADERIRSSMREI
jgi:hypothetical protein